MKKQNAILLIGAVVFTLLAAEFGLRLAGYKPGEMSGYNFVEVDSLFELKGMEADSQGIFKVTKQTAEEIADAIRQYKDSVERPVSLFDYNTHCGEQYGLADHYLDILQGHYQNKFYHWVQSIQAKPTKSAVDSLVMEYLRHPINAEGYRSIPFRKVATHQPSVLLLGDSYTWGHSTQNITNSFADLLLTKGWVVYNAGIGGTDPTQYLAVAKRYIPLLQPDFVIVNFNLGNDVQTFEYSLEPFLPTQWVTNVDYLKSCTDGVVYHSKEEVYTLLVKSREIPNTNLLNRVCRKTALTSVVWNALRKIVRLDDVPKELAQHYKRSFESKTTTVPANKQMQQIQDISKANNALLVLSAIPRVVYSGVEVDSFQTVSDFPGLFDRMQYVVPVCQQEDFTPTDEHFNDKGHAKYADFLAHILDSLVQTKAVSFSSR